MKIWTLAGMALASSLLVAPVVSQMATAQERPRIACKTDISKHCSGIKPGGGRIAVCMRKNRSSLSQSCKASIAKFRGQRGRRAATGNPQRRAVVRACRNDRRAFCSGVRRGEGRIARCMRTNRAKLSATCKGALTKARRARNRG